MGLRGAGCTGPGTWRGGVRTGCWSSWVGPTRRSSFAGSGSSPARSRRRCLRRVRCRRLWWWRGRTALPGRGLSATWWGRPMLWRRRTCGVAGVAVTCAARAHGAVCDRGAGAAAAHSERQARPPGAAIAGGDVGAGLSCAAQPAGGAAVRALCRGSGRRAGRHRGQLLRAWRSLAAGDASDQPDPGCAVCRGADPQPVRGAHGAGALCGAAGRGGFAGAGGAGSAAAAGGAAAVVCAAPALVPGPPGGRGQRPGGRRLSRKHLGRKQLGLCDPDGGQA